MKVPSKGVLALESASSRTSFWHWSVGNETLHLGGIDDHWFLLSSYSAPTPPPLSAITAIVCRLFTLTLSSLCVASQLACPSWRWREEREQSRRQQKNGGSLPIYVLYAQRSREMSVQPVFIWHIRNNVLFLHQLCERGLWREDVVETGAKVRGEKKEHRR